MSGFLLQGYDWPYSGTRPQGTAVIRYSLTKIDDLTGLLEYGRMAEPGLTAIFRSGPSCFGRHGQFTHIAGFIKHSSDLVRGQRRIVILHFYKVKTTTGIDVFYAREIKEETTYFQHVMVSIQSGEFNGFNWHRAASFPMSVDNTGLRQRCELQ